MDRHQFVAFGGARCEVLAIGADLEPVSQAVADVYAFEARLTRFDAQSELSRFNASAGRTTAVSPLLEGLLRASLIAAELTGGLVNAAVLPALLAAGYDETIERVRARDARSAEAIRDCGLPAPPPSLPLEDVLEVGPGWARLRPGACVDLGGVGKGWLADRLAERFENAVVNLGGDLRALGEGPDGGGWAIGLCDGHTVRVRDAGVATSGLTGRHWRGGHHLIDPRTSLPAATDVATVSVVAGEALAAEALAKGAAILGTQLGPVWACERGAADVRVVTTGNPANDSSNL